MNNELPPGFKRRAVEPNHCFDQPTANVAAMFDAIEQKYGDMGEVAFLRGTIAGMMVELGIPIKFASRLLRRYPT